MVISAFSMRSLWDNDFDLDDETLSFLDLISPSTAQGGTVEVDGPWVIYTPPLASGGAACAGAAVARVIRRNAANNR